MLLTSGFVTEDIKKIVEAVRTFRDDAKKYPNDDHFKIDDLSKHRGNSLMMALLISVQNNYKDGIIVLFEESRAKYVLENIEPKSQDAKDGLDFLKKLSAVFTADQQATEALDQLLTYCPARPRPSIQQTIDCVMACVERWNIKDNINENQLHTELSRKKM